MGLALLAALVAVAGVALALRAGPGSTLVTIAVGAAPSAVAVDDRAGRAFVINVADKAVGVLNTTSGRLVRTVTIGAGPSTVAVDGPTGRALVLTGNGTSSVLDVASGTLARPVAVGYNVGFPAVDARGGRVVVVNAGGSSPGLAPAPPWAAWLRRLHGWLPVVPAPTPPPPGRGTVTIFDTMR